MASIIGSVIAIHKCILVTSSLSNLHPKWGEQLLALQVTRSDHCKESYSKVSFHGLKDEKQEDIDLRY